MSSTVFPTLAGALIDVEREASYSTIVQRESGGRELRVATQSEAVYRWRISYDFLRQDAGGDEAQTLLAFFKTHRGAWDSFLFTDPYNSSVSLKSFGTGDGTTTIFYLTDEMGERVSALNGTATIFKDGFLQTVTTHYTVDSSTGQITFVSAPTAGQALTWSGYFYRRVRFADDQLPIGRRYSRVWKGEARLVSVFP